MAKKHDPDASAGAGRHPKVFSQYHELVNFRDTWRIFKIMAEFVEGYQFLAKLRGEVTFFGSARIKSGTKYYEAARKLAYSLGKSKHAIITGGGPGIMEAANKGAKESGADSIGLNIQLPMEQVLNKYVTKSRGFHYFFTRKVMLTAPSQAFVLFPGGFGTLDEFLEVVDYIELNKMEKIPVVLYDSEFWSPFVKFLKEYACEKIGALSAETLKLFTVVDDIKDAYDLIKTTRERPYFSDLSAGRFTTDEAANWRIFRIMAELVEGFEFVSGLKKDITILGTKSIGAGTKYYNMAYELAKKLGKSKHAIITGGGPGIMEAANKGAREVGAPSIGLNLRYDHQIRINPYVDKSISFFFPFVRKLIVTAPSLAFVVFPGGLGTLHQAFELLTLVQTKKTGKMPLIFVGSEYWKNLDKFIRTSLRDKYKTISGEDVNYYKIVDDVGEICRIIKECPRKEF
jgi:uncharacterized protein (TIGR00730 family)